MRNFLYLRVEEGLLLLEFLESNGGLHDLGGVVNFAVLDEFEAVVDDALHGVVALGVATE